MNFFRRLIAVVALLLAPPVPTVGQNYGNIKPGYIIGLEPTAPQSAPAHPIPNPQMFVDPRVNGADPTGTADSATALLTACTAAMAQKMALLLVGHFKTGSNQTYGCDIQFSPGSMLDPMPGTQITLAGRVLAEDTQQIFATPPAPVSFVGNTTVGSPTIQLDGTTDTSAVEAGALLYGPFFPFTIGGALPTVVSKTTNSITISVGAYKTFALAATNTPIQLSVQARRVIIADGPGAANNRVSVAWWGAMAAPDAGPSLRIAGGNDRVLYWPPATYKVTSSTASPYPGPYGSGWNIIVEYHSYRDFEIDARGAALTSDAAHANTQLLFPQYMRGFKIHGMHFLAYSAPFTGSLSGTTLTYPTGTDIVQGTAISGAGVPIGTYIKDVPSCNLSTCTVAVTGSGATVSNGSMAGGLPCCEPSGLGGVNIYGFEYYDLYWDGNWGGTHKNPAGLAITWMKDGTYHDLHMPTMSLCADTGFLQNTRWYNMRLQGADDAGNVNTAGTGNGAVTNCLNVERDTNFLGYYPKIATDAGYSSSISNSFGPGINATGFTAGLYIRAGQQYQIQGNDFSDNPGSGSIGPGGAGHGIGAGVYVMYDTQSGVQTWNDAPDRIAITGNTMNRNGLQSGGDSHSSTCGITPPAARGFPGIKTMPSSERLKDADLKFWATGWPGAGVVLDGSCAGQTTFVTNDRVRVANGGGPTITFQSITLPGWLAMHEVSPIYVRNLTNPSGIPAGTTMVSADVFTGLVNLSASANVAIGDNIEFYTTAYGSNAVMGGIAITGNNFDDNETGAIQTFAPNGVLQPRIANNSYTSATGRQVYPWDIGSTMASGVSEFDISWFGFPAGPNADDSTSALQSACTRLPDISPHGGMLRLMTGEYYFNSQVGCSLPAPGRYALGIHGSGPEATKLHFKPSALNGLLIFNDAQNNSVSIRDMTIETEKAGGGNGLELVGSQPLSSGHFPGSDVTNVLLTGDDHAAHYWTQAYAIKNWSGVNTTNMNIYGGAGGYLLPLGKGVSVAGDASIGSYTLNTQFNNLNVINAESQFRYGEYVQGVALIGGGFYFGTTGIYNEGGVAGILTGLFLQGTQFGIYGKSMDLQSPVDSITISGGLAYANKANEIVLNLPWWAGGSISNFGMNYGGTFSGEPDSYQNTTGIYIDALGGVGAPGTILGNQFYGLLNGVTLGNYADKLTIGPNAFHNTITHTSHRDTNNGTITMIDPDLALWATNSLPDPPPTALTAGVMAGLNQVFAAGANGQTCVRINGMGGNDTAGQGVAVQAYIDYVGNTPVPTPGQTPKVGTPIGNIAAPSNATAGMSTPFSVGGCYKLTPGKPFWVDLGMAAWPGSGNASASNLTVDITEQ